MRKLFTGLLFIFLGLILTGCSDSADEKSIRSNIQTMREAIQNHDKDTFMKYVAPGYSGQYHRSRPVLERFVIEQLGYHKKIYIYMADTSIEVNDDVANVIFYAGTAGGPDQVPDHGQLFKVQTKWKKFSGDWQLTNARWRPALTR